MFPWAQQNTYLYLCCTTETETICLMSVCELLNMHTNYNTNEIDIMRKECLKVTILFFQRCTYIFSNMYTWRQVRLPITWENSYKCKKSKNKMNTRILGGKLRSRRWTCRKYEFLYIDQWIFFPDLYWLLLCVARQSQTSVSSATPGKQIKGVKFTNQSLYFCTWRRILPKEK